MLLSDRTTRLGEEVSATDGNLPQEQAGHREERHATGLVSRRPPAAVFELVQIISITARVPTMTTRKDSRLLAALTSPIRQEIVVALEGRRSATIAELAARLGRRPDALYHHVRALERAGLVISELTAARVGRPATKWRLTVKAVNVSASDVSGSRAAYADRIVRAMMRSSLRDYRRALRGSVTSGIRPNAGRSSIWLDPAERREVGIALTRLLARLRAHEPRPGRTPHVLTYVFAPAPDRLGRLRARKRGPR